MFLSSKVTITITFKKGEKVRMYVNGELIGEENAVYSLDADNLFIGHDDSRRLSKLTYEGLRFYNRALTAAEVA